MRKPLLLFLFITLLIACSAPIKKQIVSTISPSQYITPAGDKIIFLDDYYTDYLKAIRTNFSKNDSLYMVKVQTPIVSGYFLKGEYSELAKEEFPGALTDTTELAGFISEIDTNKQKIEKLIISALAESRKYLKNDSVTIYVKPANAGWKAILQKMGGVSAVTTGSKQILLTVDPEVSAWAETIEYTIAHEYNHTYWTKMFYASTTNWSLLNYLVFEGRADSYAHLIYPNIKCPWDSALTEKEKADLWSEIKPELENSDFRLGSSVMFGGNGYPIWGGYTLGYDIVQSAIKNNPKLTPAELSALSPKKILEMSDYKTTQ